MTKAEAIKKVSRLRRQAEGTSNAHEASTARTIAERLCAEHHIDERDLLTASYVGAYDELVKDLKAKLNDRLSLSYSVFNLREVLDHVTPTVAGVGDDEKVNRVRTIVKIVRGANLLAGTVPAVAEVCTLVESIVKKYEITI